MLFRTAVVSDKVTEVGTGLLVIFAVGAAVKVEFVKEDEGPVGTVELEGAGIPVEVTSVVELAMMVELTGGLVGLVSLPVEVGSNVALTDVTLVGRGKTTVVDVNGTMRLVMEEFVALVGRGKISVVEFKGRTMLVDADTRADVLLRTVSEGRAAEIVVLRIVGAAVPAGGKAVALLVTVSEGRAPETVVLRTVGAAVPDEGKAVALLGAVSDGKIADAVVLVLEGTAVPDGNTDSELLLVGKGGSALVASGRGSDVALPVSNGTKSVVELLEMMTLVAAAVPLTTIVVRLPVTAPADKIVLPGKDSLDVGKGATSVVVFNGMMMLVAAAVPPALRVEKLAVTSPTEAEVLLANGGLIVVTDGNNVLLM